MLNEMRKKFISQKGFAPIGMIVLLIAGIGIGTYLVSQRTNLLPKASETGGFSSAQTNGCGEILSTPSQGASEGNLSYKAPVRGPSGWETHKADGQVITQQEIIQKTHGDTRNNNEEFLGDTYINCNIYISYTSNGDCDVDPPPFGREGVNGGKLTPGQEVTFHVKSDSSPQSPGCRIQMQTEIQDGGGGGEEEEQEEDEEEEEAEEPGNSSPRGKSDENWFIGPI
jgi:hypothetical protein